MSIIYMITNLINWKTYIGATVKEMLDRWDQHLELAESGKGYALHAAIRKYGADNFKIETIYTHDDAKHVFNEMEPKFIIEHNSLARSGWGYNLTEGGDGMVGFVHSEETREKMSIAHSGKVRSPEHCAKISAVLRGKKRTPEQIEKNRLGHIGLKHTPESSAKKSAALRGRKIPPHILVKRIGRKKSPETCKKISIANKGKKRSLETRAKIQQSKMGTKQSPETIAKRIETRKRNRLLKKNPPSI